VIRPRLRQLGVAFLTDSVVLEWHGDAATVRDLLTNAESRQAFDSLVLATTNVSETELAGRCARRDRISGLGDCVSPRHARRRSSRAAARNCVVKAKALRKKVNKT